LPTIGLQLQIQLGAQGRQEFVEVMGQVFEGDDEFGGRVLSCRTFSASASNSPKCIAIKSASSSKSRAAMTSGQMVSVAVFILSFLAVVLRLSVIPTFPGVW